MNEAIEAIIAERKIERLVHFTRLDHLPSILANGLIPRIVVKEVAPDVAINDVYRFDGRKWWNCLSITFPNSRMFYRYQQDNPEIEWCVLLISPRILTEKTILFCKHNAADKRISKAADHTLSSVDAFEGMFCELDGVDSRADQQLKDADPTDLQAEVLVRGVIETEYFDGVVFRTAAAAMKYKAELGSIKGYRSDQRGLFAHRGFYRKWGRGK